MEEINDLLYRLSAVQIRRKAHLRKAASTFTVEEAHDGSCEVCQLFTGAREIMFGGRAPVFEDVEVRFARQCVNAKGLLPAVDQHVASVELDREANASIRPAPLRRDNTSRIRLIPYELLNLVKRQWVLR